jgi:hypothetical protein
MSEAFYLAQATCERYELVSLVPQTFQLLHSIAALLDRRECRVTQR